MNCFLDRCRRGCIPSCQFSGPQAQPASGRPASRIAASPITSPVRSAGPGARRLKYLVNSIMSLQPLFEEDAPCGRPSAGRDPRLPKPRFGQSLERPFRSAGVRTARPSPCRRLLSASLQRRQPRQNRTPKFCAATTRARCGAVSHFVASAAAAPDTWRPRPRPSDAPFVSGPGNHICGSELPPTA